jgi:hypothetical protein
MKKTFQTLAVFGVVGLSLFLSSCKVVRVHTADAQDITKTHIIQMPLVADLEVDMTRKVTGFAKLKKTSKDFVKMTAMADALKNSGADVLVEPSYDISYTRSSVEVTVTGYAAKYKNVRKPNIEDVTLIQELKDSRYIMGDGLNVGIQEKSAENFRRDKLVKKRFFGR